MDEDCEQTMQKAADIARNRRSVELRRRKPKVSTEDASSQTNNDTFPDTKSQRIFTPTGHRQTTILCYMSFVLVISNLSQLRLTFSISQHRHFYVILGLLLLSLVIQCLIAIYLAYFTKRDMDNRLDPTVSNDVDRPRNVLFVFLSIVTIVNVCVFVLS